MYISKLWARLNHGITDYHICMHVDHIHREIFHAECWEFRLLCDNCAYPTIIHLYMVSLPYGRGYAE